MPKAREPEIIFISQGVSPGRAYQLQGKWAWKFVTKPKLGPNIVASGDHRTFRIGVSEPNVYLSDAY